MRHARMMLVTLFACLAAQPALATAPRGTPTLTTAQIANTLARMHDPDALVTAALMGPVANDEARQTTRLKQAQQLDPGAADITALTMLSCQATRACDAVAMGDRLHELDPDNALAWMPRLQRAIARGDANAVTRTLQRMAQSSHFDSYWVSTLGRLDHGLALAPSPDGKPVSRKERFGYAIALAGFVMPNFQGLITACKPGASRFRARRTSCRAIGVMMESSPMLLTNMIGTILHRRAARDRSDYVHALQVTRDLVWTQDNFADLTSNDMSLHGLETYLRDIRSSGTETGAMRRVLQRAHVSSRPPDNRTNRQLEHLLKEDHSPYSARAHGKG